MAEQDRVESRIRSLAAAYRQRVDPAPGFHGRIMSRVSSGARPASMSFVQQVSLAALLVVVAILGVALSQIRHNRSLSVNPTPPANASVVPTPGASPSLNPTATPTPLASPTPGSRSIGMQVMDISFVDASHGWAVGASCTQSGGCSPQMRGTADGGRTWVTLSAPPLAVGSGAPSWHVRFANAQDGWVYGPRLFETHDGGSTWSDSGLSVSTVSLGAVGASVWAVVSVCSASDCHLVLDTSNDAGRSWAPATVQPQLRGPNAELVRVSENTGWVLSWGPLQSANPPVGSSLVATSDGGRTWQMLTTPCAVATSDEDRMAALAGGPLWIVCGGQPGAGQQQKQLVISRDGGQTWSFPPNAPSAGYLSDLALSAPSVGWLGVAPTGLYASRNGGQGWQPAAGIPNDGGPAVIRVIFVDASHGWAATSARVYRTTDGGSHWY